MLLSVLNARSKYYGERDELQRFRAFFEKRGALSLRNFVNDFLIDSMRILARMDEIMGDLFK